MRQKLVTHNSAHEDRKTRPLHTNWCVHPCTEPVHAHYDNNQYVTLADSMNSNLVPMRPGARSIWCRHQQCSCTCIHRSTAHSTIYTCIKPFIRLPMFYAHHERIHTQHHVHPYTIITVYACKRVTGNTCACIVP